VNVDRFRGGRRAPIAADIELVADLHGVPPEKKNKMLLSLDGDQLSAMGGARLGRGEARQLGGIIWPYFG
jgi:hypothetical protein